MSSYTATADLYVVEGNTKLKVFHLASHPVTLTSFPDQVVSLEVGSGINVEATAKVQGAKDAEQLALTITDNVKGLPADLVEAIDLSKASYLVRRGADLAEYAGLEFVADLSIVRSA